MVFCAVIGCSNNSQKTQGVSYFRFPSLRSRGTSYDHPRCAKRLVMWIKALRRADLTMNKITHERVCSNHFISGSPANVHDEGHPDWVPSLNLGYTKVDGKFRRTKPEKEVSHYSEEEEEEEEDVDYDDEPEENNENEEEEDYGKSKVMLGTTCIVDSCKNNLLKTRKRELNIFYYRFPVDEKLLCKWKDRCHLGDHSIPKSARICSEHFKEDDFHTSSFQGKRQLKSEAVPSVKLGSGNVKLGPKNANNQAKQKIKGNSSNSEDEISEGSDYEKTIKVRIAPMDEGSSSDEGRLKRKSKKRKLSTGSDIKALNLGNSSADESEGKPLAKTVKYTSKKKKPGRRRKVYDDREDDEDFEPFEEGMKDEEIPTIVMPPSLGSMLKEGKLVPDDRETIIKMLEERILEHSRIIEDNNVTPFKSKKKVAQSVFTKSTTFNTTEPTNENEEAVTFSIPISELQIEDNLNLKTSGKTMTNLPEAGQVVIHEPIDEAIPEDYDGLKTKYESLLGSLKEVQNENAELKKSLVACREELDTKVDQLKASNELRDSYVAKLTKIETCLSKVLTPNQIKLLLNDVKKVSWTPQEMLSAFTIRFLSKRCYYYLRQKLNYPLPGISSVQRWAAVMTKQHGGNLKEVENAVYLISGNGEDEEEDDQVMFFPNATDDVVIEGSNEGQHNNAQESEAQEAEMEQVKNDEFKEHVIYLKQEDNWEQSFTCEDNEEYEGKQEQTGNHFPEQDLEHESEGPLLKALLIGEKAEGEMENSEGGEHHEMVTIVQEDGTINNTEGFPQNVILVESVEGADPETIQWQVAENEDGHYYIANHDQLAELEGENIQVITEEGLIENRKKLETKSPVAIFNPEGGSDQILHYLYGINDVSPLTVNNSADHSYAIATIDKYIRTKERHKNRKPSKKT